MNMLPAIVSVVFLVPVSVGCVLARRCRTLRSLRALRIGLTVSYVALGLLVVVFSIIAKLPLGR
jgi:hypothetical protein